jgi:hypothetical protein
MFYLMTLSFSGLYGVGGRRKNYDYGALVERYDKGSPNFSEENVSKCHSRSFTSLSYDRSKASSKSSSPHSAI